MGNEIDLEKVMFSRKPDVVSADMDGEAVLLDVNSGVYYGLDSTGARIWNLMEEKISFENIISKLLDEYSVTHEQCQAETKQFVKEVLAKDLIKVESI